MAGIEPPQDVAIDGRDLTPLLLHGKPPEERPLFYYRGDQLAACRIGPYGQPKREQHAPPLLFHLGLHPSEKRNVAGQHAEVIARIQAAVQDHTTGVVAVEPQLR